MIERLRNGIDSKSLQDFPTCDMVKELYNKRSAISKLQAVTIAAAINF